VCDEIFVDMTINVLSQDSELLLSVLADELLSQVSTEPDMGVVCSDVLCSLGESARFEGGDVVCCSEGPHEGVR
jgi:hypothetical protein